MAMTSWNKFLVLVMWIGLVWLSVVLIATWRRARTFRNLDVYSTYQRWRDNREPEQDEPAELYWDEQPE